MLFRSTAIVTIRYLAGVLPLQRILTDDNRCLDILGVVYPERRLDDVVTLHCKERIAWQPLND